MILQLNPPIPVDVVSDDPRRSGWGYAWLVTDYSQEHDMLWTVAMGESREVWQVPTSMIRAPKNLSLERV